MISCCLVTEKTEEEMLIFLIGCYLCSSYYGSASLFYRQWVNDLYLVPLVVSPEAKSRVTRFSVYLLQSKAYFECYTASCPWGETLEMYEDHFVLKTNMLKEHQNDLLYQAIAQ